MGCSGNLRKTGRKICGKAKHMSDLDGIISKQIVKEHRKQLKRGSYFGELSEALR